MELSNQGASEEDLAVSKVSQHLVRRLTYLKAGHGLARERLFAPTGKGGTTVEHPGLRGRGAACLKG